MVGCEKPCQNAQHHIQNSRCHTIVRGGINKVDGEVWTNFIRHVVDEKKKMFLDMDFNFDDVLAEQQSWVVSYVNDLSDEFDEI